MTQYTGTKSLDAEFELDFKTRTILFDYSKNNLAGFGDSNHSALLPGSTWLNLPLKTRIKPAAADTFVRMFSVFIDLGVLGLTILSRWFSSNESLHLYYQQMLKWLFIARSGTYVQEISGSIPSKNIKFVLENNIWFSYNLDGDYEKNLERIYFLRRFVKFKRYGQFEEMRQCGWD
ncbi:MAG: hypothetical protein PHP63_08885, partial [Candidatus Marinimicrobia bacterium]|nr:hypothetical protein [Candidatus Neomarinimicrobiota bacterium]